MQPTQMNSPYQSSIEKFQREQKAKKALHLTLASVAVGLAAPVVGLAAPISAYLAVPKQAVSMPGAFVMVLAAAVISTWVLNRKNNGLSVRNGPEQ
jgi:DMSO reductase anchor subunit